MTYRDTFSPVTLEMNSPSTYADPSSAVIIIVFFNSSAQRHSRILTFSRQTDRRMTEYTKRQIYVPCIISLMMCRVLCSIDNWYM